MGATLIDGRAESARVLEQVAADAAGVAAAHGRAPGLATVLVGDDPASHTYVAAKHRACERAGIASVDRRLPADAAQDVVEGVVRELVADDAIDGVLVQLPLPPQLDADAVVALVPAEKDVDGFHPANLGGTALGLPGALPSCTPAGVMHLLDAHDVELEGAEAVVVGRSRMVGTPMAMMLLARHATVTVVHLATRDLRAHVARADVLVVAAGAPGLVTADMVQPGAVVVDVGTTPSDAGLLGDVDPGVAEVAGLLTPVPGGVGPMTIAMLLRNTVRAAQARLGA